MKFWSKVSNINQYTNKISNAQFVSTTQNLNKIPCKTTSGPYRDKLLPDFIDHVFRQTINKLLFNYFFRLILFHMATNYKSISKKNILDEQL